MYFDRALSRADKRVFRKTGTPVLIFNDEFEIPTYGVFDNPELLQTINSMKGRQSIIEIKATERLLSMPTPSVDVKNWSCTVRGVDFYIEKTLSDGCGETLCILSTNFPESETIATNDYGI